MPPRATTTTAKTATKAVAAPAKPRAPRTSTRKAAPVAATPTVNTQQFSGNMSHLGGLYTSMTEAGLTSDSQINDHMGEYRRTLFHAAAASAPEHPTLQSLGHALNVNPTMHGFNSGDAVTVPKQSKFSAAMGNIGSYAKAAVKIGRTPTKEYNLADHARGNSPGKTNRRQQRKIGNSGNNARVLKGATGAL